MDASPPAPARSPWKKWAVRAAIVAVVLLIVGGVIAQVFLDDIIERRLRPATIALLEDRLRSKVELASLDVRFLPTMSVRGEGLVVRHQGRTDIPPFITIRAFTISGSVRELWSRHLDAVHLEGLEIMIPPGRGADMPRVNGGDGASGGDGESQVKDVVIHEIITENSLLTIMSKHEGKRPRVFQLRRLRFESFRFDEPTAFQAALTNPTPTGEIEARGTFGPWASEEPRTTPINGTFVFDADLASIKGIGGSLHAEGTFDGPLELIRTSGRTRTEDFYLSTGGAKFPLTVDYDAVVDGTNGDTHLTRVDGMLGVSRIQAKGEIVRVEGKSGRQITLDTTTTGGRLEDFIKLTTRATSSPMTGRVDVKAKIDIPPGDNKDIEVIERMVLDGTFSVARASFTSDAIQARVDELSRRGQGKPKDESIDDVASDLRGTFRLADATMTLQRLTFKVNGAEVRLAGTYRIRPETLDFKGELRLQARASQTMTGWKSLVLKLFDPMLDGEGAGTILPISVTGTKDEPKFGADIKKAIFK